jgi:hypothetical protein
MFYNKFEALGAGSVADLEFNIRGTIFFMKKLLDSESKNL